MFSTDRLRWGVLAAAAAVLVWQLALPPIVGLADQGDFRRVIGRFGYAPEDKSPPLYYAFVPRKFIPETGTRARDVEQATPEYFFVGAALLLNWLVSKDGKLDIIVVGLVHAAAFLAAFALLLKAVPNPAFWLLALLALTDVGYAAYFNSFYTEPASLIFFLLLAGESILIYRGGAVSPARMAWWSLWAALWVDAKSSNFPLALVLVPLALRLGWWAQARAARNVAIFGAAAIAAAALWSMQTRPRLLRMATAYDALFMAILPESKNPPADLMALGLDPRFARLSGSGAWSPDTAFPEMVRSGILDARLTSATIGRFYLLHPGRMWRRAKAVLPVAFSLRPEWCGNFERSAGQPPGARSNAFSLWSSFHAQVLSRFGKSILLLLIFAPLAAIVAWIRFPLDRLRYEFYGALYLSCLIAFLVPVLGDAWDNVKHLFLFNLLLDSCLAVMLAPISRFARLKVWRRKPMHRI